jgi:hypothetical protein
MKNQYFGDVNDYRKYGLLRALSGYGDLKIGVCWMLTPNDGRTDGRFVRYLDDPSAWRRFDPQLFDALRRCVKADRIRNVQRAERDGILPSARFFAEEVTDDRAARQGYVRRMLEHIADVDLAFFDPDNGLEVRSKPLGQKNSSKYLYKSELKAAYEAGHSVLVYQHFARENRRSFVTSKAAEIHTCTGVPRLYAYRTARVVFLLAAQPRHADHFRARTERLSETWAGQITPSEHTFAR